MPKFKPNFTSVLDKDPPQEIPLLGYYPDTNRITIAFWDGTRTDTGVPVVKDVNDLARTVTHYQKLTPSAQKLAFEEHPILHTYLRIYDFLHDGWERQRQAEIDARIEAVSIEENTQEPIPEESETPLENP